MREQTTAELLLAHIGVYSAMLGTKITYRGATPIKKDRMRKGEDGQRKAGAYGKGLRNWCNRVAHRNAGEKLERRQ